MGPLKSNQIKSFWFMEIFHYFSSHIKSTISTICVCFSVFNNLISLIKLSVDVFDKFTLATHFTAYDLFVSWKLSHNILIIIQHKHRKQIEIINSYFVFCMMDNRIASSSNNFQQFIIDYCRCSHTFHV